MSGTDGHDEGEGSSYYVCTTIVKSTSTTEVICHSARERSPGADVGEQTTSPSKLSTPPTKLPIEVGFKHYGSRMRLYCRSGHCITILTDGSIIGDKSRTNVNVLEFSSAGIGEVRIRGVEANLYLAMNKKGNLYGEEDPRDYATVFIEGTYGQYNTYLSQKYAHQGWYVGIKKNGTVKKGPLTKWGQKAIQFLPIRD